MSILTNLKKRGLKDILNPTKWKIFLRNEVRKKSGITIQDEDMIAYCEQVIYRLNSCRPCLEKGECTHCGCKTPDLFFDKDMVCSGGQWPAMKKTEDWESFKEDGMFEVGVKYKI